MIDLAVERGANVNAHCGPNQETALQAASSAGHLEVFQFLIHRGADADAFGADNFLTALQAAFEMNHLDAVQHLVVLGADINRYAIQAASEPGHLWLVQCLAEKGLVSMHTTKGFQMH